MKNKNSFEYFEEELKKAEDTGFSATSSSKIYFSSLVLKKAIQVESVSDFLLFKNFLKDALTKYYNKILKSITGAITKGCSGLNKKDIKRVINSNWSGELYSQRLWGHLEKLRREVESIVYKRVIGTFDEGQMTKRLIKRFNVSESQAKRLITTESARAMNEVKALACIREGYTHYRIEAVLDSRTSEICREMNGKVFAFDERVVGVNFPIFHINCRTTFVPVKKN